MEQSLLRLETNPTDEAALSAIFRYAHTMKGSAGIFNFTDIVEFMHGLEQTLSPLRAGERGITSPVISLLLQCVDHSRALVEATAKEPDRLDKLSSITRELLLRLGIVPEAKEKIESMPEKAGHTIDSISSAFNRYIVDFFPGADTFRLGLDPLAPLRQIREVCTVHSIETIVPEFGPDFVPESCLLSFRLELETDNIKENVESFFEFFSDARLEVKPAGPLRSSTKEKSSEIPETASTKAIAGPVPSANHAMETGAKKLAEAARPNDMEKKGEAHRFIRVDTDKLDQLVNLVGELVIAGAGMADLTSKRQDPVLLESSRSISRMIADLRDRSLRVRMIPLAQAFARFHRAVREVCLETGKDVELSIQTGDTELDKNVVEQIIDPLLHLIRNAVDHGIEPGQDRVQAGKPVRGLITISAYQETGSVVVEVADDGAGFNKEKIIQKAMSRNLLPEAEEISDSEAFNLLFLPGFSTRDQVSRISGRGVGLDVVRERIDNLRGSVELSNRATGGGLIKIRLPLTLAIIEGFLVRAASEIFIIPMDLVIECIDIADLNLEPVSEYLNLRGEVLPCLNLSGFFKLEKKTVLRPSAVIVGYAGKKAGLIVDGLLGEFQTVIKPLSKIFAELRGISGSTILGDGNVALILDIPGLLEGAVEQAAPIER